MEKKYDVISMAEAVVEIFRKQPDIGFDVAADFIGPFPSGSPSITADTLARLGCKCAVFAAVGMDGFGDCLVNRLEGDGVDVSGMYRCRNVMTGLAFTHYFSNGDRRFIYNFKTAATAYLPPGRIDTEMIKASNWLHICGNGVSFGAATRKAIYKAVEAAYDSGVSISLDPNIRLEIMQKGRIEQLLRPILERTTLLMPSMGELALIYGEDMDEADIISSRLPACVKVVARKEGAGGCTVFSGGEALHVDAFTDIEVVDPTGCGDNFGAGFLFGMINGWDLRRTAVFANAAGAITATKKGAMEGLTGMDEIRRFLEVRGHQLTGVTK